VSVGALSAITKQRDVSEIYLVGEEKNKATCGLGEEVYVCADSQAPSKRNSPLMQYA